MPTGLTSIQQLLDVDGVTPIGMLITGTDGRSVTANAITAPGALTSDIQTAVQTLIKATFPELAVFCHCFSVTPYSIALWTGTLGTAPINATWWIKPV